MKKRGMSVGIGIMSLLMIFIILCMVILSVLSYQNASQSEALAMREKTELTQYYEAQQSASILYATLQKETGKNLQELKALAEDKAESMKQEVTISLEDDILTLEIGMDDGNHFLVQLDSQLQIKAWGYGKE